MSDQRPTRARVYADRAPAAAAGSPAQAVPTPTSTSVTPAPVPRRRRTDRPLDAQGREIGSSIGWMTALILFVVGSALGGVLSVGLGLIEMPIR